jgi:uncharacterized protein (DUF697 family)
MMAPRTDLVIPIAARDVDAAIRRSRTMVRTQSLFAAGVAMVPVPGLDWLTDLGVLMKLTSQINEQFGLSNAQIERMAPDRRVAVYKALTTSGGLLVGKVVTQELVLKTLKIVGIRLTSQQAAKFVPIAGQALSAALTYTALRYVCEQHIQHCAAVAKEVGAQEPLEILQRDDEPPARALKRLTR